jgi:hypothetical protein
MGLIRYQLSLVLAYIAGCNELVFGCNEVGSIRAKTFVWLPIWRSEARPTR